ncbi:SDR family oxidoreductase [Parasphingopyxis lamellibrachiae]|uniref:NAD(P)-dependent dehydrogenase (Short-subunit alcohol dehydrogenase family) n=1 Tax=Parasphingopyxis lamellibrachiae TaxID=680125 RepID=A0A3D9FE83_9SPHN|nr:SDR family oxidoreductase [Parasphingopyxis lamellibrachiae]RED16144.1 NAD(P)-dependent dehydrogenase (short-subunit alcohol dehydrogenase family) [Parasphingopyxis lamellibrachiae]
MRVAIVTGGCRRLGAAIAGRLANEGYALALHASEDIDPEPALLAAIEQAGVQWQGIVADLSDPVQVEHLVPAIADRFGSAPDLLVNSAARFGDDRPETADMDGLLSHYAVNCAAPAILAKSFAALKRKGNAGIVNILDQRIANPHGDQFSYTLSKLGLAGLTRILAGELAPAIRVNAVAPGLTIPTDSYDDAMMEYAEALMPLKTLPAPAQVADAVAWLAQADAVTGQTIFVDGGAHMEAFERDFPNLTPDS